MKAAYLAKIRYHGLFKGTTGYGANIAPATALGGRHFVVTDLWEILTYGVWVASRWHNYRTVFCNLL